ncbi:hypothetical protein BDN70DRAFT_371295 [Pholiota conissans]|uniref:Uncharacterized protein n=1 Tax=Pholiota conissans TaxID=109636 RepID=A0A9P6D7W5_9AGAR|nr:hypothetical protein BDN70DRAFT_371295 [Pholiota conissans]
MVPVQKNLHASVCEWMSFHRWCYHVPGLKCAEVKSAFTRCLSSVYHSSVLTWHYRSLVKSTVFFSIVRKSWNLSMFLIIKFDTSQRRIRKQVDTDPQSRRLRGSSSVQEQWIDRTILWKCRYGERSADHGNKIEYIHIKLSIWEGVLLLFDQRSSIESI